MTPTSLCQLAQDWHTPIPVSGLVVEEKINGWRALYFKGIDGVPRLWTRNGMPIEGAAHILHRLAQFEAAAGLPLFIDGEFQVDGSLEATKRWCESGWKQGGTAGVFYAFDICPFAEWREGGWDAPWRERKAWLSHLAKQVNAAPDWDWREGSHGADEGRPTVGILMESWAFDVLDVRDAACRVWGAGGEGIVLKDPAAPYLRSRTQSWLKVKAPAQFARAA